MDRPAVFISYSHKDETEKEVLMSHLSVLQHAGLIHLWSDDQIGAGTNWDQEISQAINDARIAVLLISANYLSSDFILRKEVPTLLKRREREGIVVFPVIIKACAWRSVNWLSQMQVRPKHGNPVWGDIGSHVDEDLAAIAEEITFIMNPEQKEFEELKNAGIPDASKRIKESEIVSGFDWPKVRQIVRLASQYVSEEQKVEGVWLRSDLFPTARTFFGLLVSGVYFPDEIIERSANWIKTHLTDPQEQPDAVAMAVVALKEASKVGIESSITDGIDIILQKQKFDGYWGGRFALDRYSAASTAYCVQALRAFMAMQGPDPESQKACYKGAQYLEKYFRSLDLENCKYNDIVNPIEALMLPGYEAWGIVDQRVVQRAIEFLKNSRSQFKRFGNTKAVAGILGLLLTQWRSFDVETIGELLSWLLDARNQDHGWSEHVGESSEPHHTVMVSLPIRQIERLGNHYIPLSISDDWSLPVGNDIVKERSVGAVVFRQLIGKPEIVLLRRQNGTWVLPKGHIEAGEAIEETLRREITEETGIKALKISEKLDEYRYLFRPNRDIVDKTVIYFLVECLDINISLKPDLDHSEVKWFPIDDIPLLPIYYDDARQVIERARFILRQRET